MSPCLARVDDINCTRHGWIALGAGVKQALRLSFRIPYRVNFGQSLGLVGSGESLGNWDPKRTVHMKWSDGDNWTVELTAPVSQGWVQHHRTCRLTHNE